MSVITMLSELVGDAFEAVGLDRALGQVVVSQRPELAQFQSNGALAGAKSAGRPSRDVAADVAGILEDNDVFADVAIAGPGFINLSLTGETVAGLIQGVADDERVGVTEDPGPGVTVVDYGGPNVAKELHVGHLRPALIGEALKRTLRFRGRSVLGDVHLGDWGLPMGQLIVEMEDRRPDLPYFDPIAGGPFPAESPVSMEDLQEMYPVAAGRAKEDPVFAERARRATFELQDGRPGYRALWEHFRVVSVAALTAVYEDLGVEFDLWFGESSVHDRIAPMVERMRAAGVAVESDGAVVVDVALPDDTSEIPPLMLVKSDGGYTYATTDLATIDLRIDEFDAREVLYVVDARQSLHFEQVFRAARKASIVPDGVVLEHPGNGTVNGPDGKPLKTRDGGLPLLRELISDAVRRAGERMAEMGMGDTYPAVERADIARQVGLAALKYGDLANHRSSNYVFDVDRFTSFEGRTGPYLQYAAVRIGSILRNAGDRDLEPGPVLPAASDVETDLALILLRLPEVIDRTIETRSPNHLAEYAYDVSTRFSRFYDTHHILSEPDPDRRGSWLTLVSTTRRVLELVLGLLGVTIPERM